MSRAGTENATPKMDAALKAQWIAALRSGEYEQAKGRLRVGNAFCCLGVLCQVAGIESRDEALIVTEGDFAISLEVQRTFSTMNDGGKTFSEIADHIEATL